MSLLDRLLEWHNSRKIKRFVVASTEYMLLLAAYRLKVETLHVDDRKKLLHAWWDWLKDREHSQQLADRPQRAIILFLQEHT